MLSMYANAFSKNLQNVVLNFEDNKEFQRTSCWNNNFDKAEHLDEKF